MCSSDLRLHDGVTSSPRSVLDRRVAAAQKVLSGCPSAIDAEAFARTCALVGDADRPLYLGAVATGRPLMQYGPAQRPVSVRSVRGALREDRGETRPVRAGCFHLHYAFHGWRGAEALVALHG